MEERKKGGFLFFFFEKAHGNSCSSSALIQNRERLSCETSGPTQSQNPSRWDSAQKHAQSREPLAEKLHCVRVSVASRLFPVTIRTAKFHPDVCVLFCYLSSQNKSKY